jgi:hypothetical protein
MAMVHELYERVAMDGSANGRSALVCVHLSNYSLGCLGIVRRPR